MSTPPVSAAPAAPGLPRTSTTEATPPASPRRSSLNAALAAPSPGRAEPLSAPSETGGAHRSAAPHPAAPRPTTAAALAALVGATVLMAAGWLLIPFTGDLPVTQALNTLHTGPVALATDAVYRALEPGFAVVLTLLTAGLIALQRRDLATGLRFGLGVALTWLPVGAVKLVVHRPRPEAALLAHPTPVPSFDWSFPSGHMAFVTAAAVMAVLLCRTARSRSAAVVLGALAVVGMALVVLVAGVHYPTDVAASAVWAMLVGPLMWQAAGLAADRGLALVHRARR